MRVAHYLIQGRSGLFYFRLRVPQDLRNALNLRLIKRALGTRCPRTALACATAWAARYAQFFDALRRGNMAKPTADEITARLRELDGRNSEYLIEQGPGGFRIQADGADDHARAMDAIANIGRVSHDAFLQTPRDTPAPALQRIALIDAIEKWCKAIKNPGRKTIGAKKRAVLDLHNWKQGELDAKAEEIGGKGARGTPVFVDQIDKTVCGEWFIHLKSLRMFNKKTKQMEPYAPGTISNKFMYAIGFFDWAMANGHYPDDDNPAEGHANVPKKVKKARASSHGAQAFELAQLELMFNPIHYATMRVMAARWVPLLLLFTGARSNEIGRLELADIYEHPKGCEPGTGTKVLQFSRVGDDKSLKNDSSERKTPIHPILIALGFWNFVEQHKASHKAAQKAVMAGTKAKLPDDELAALVAAEGSTQKLFPSLTFSAQNGPANAAQTAFRRLLARLGIKARGAGKVGHHSFRDTVINKMKQSGISQEVRHEYTGHENDDRENAAAYEQLFSPKALAEKVHPVLDWQLDIEGLKPLLMGMANIPNE